jgi:hypothetical protein
MIAVNSPTKRYPAITATNVRSLPPPCAHCHHHALTATTTYLLPPPCTIQDSQRVTDPCVICCISDEMCTSMRMYNFETVSHHLYVIGSHNMFLQPQLVRRDTGVFASEHPCSHLNSITLTGSCSDYLAAVCILTRPFRLQGHELNLTMH